MATLPVCSLLALLLWWLPQGHYSHDYAVALVLTALTAYIITETNNTYMLLRTRSRMVASVWVFGTACVGLLHPFAPALPATFCLAVSYYLLFRTYQRSHPPVTDVFHTFAMLAMGSLFYPPVLYLAPFFLWYLTVFMRVLSFRTFFAALVGLLLPFWFWGGWLLWQGDFGPLLTWFGDLRAQPWIWHHPLQPEVLLRTQGLPLLVFLIVAAFTLWTGVAYLFHSYDDKIRTRMMFYVYVFQCTLILVFACLACSGETLQALLPMLLLSASPLLAHYFTLSLTWTSLVVFLLFLLAALFLGLCTLFPEVVLPLLPIL